jgi:DNA-binding IclR family transcriptional regulator
MMRDRSDGNTLPITQSLLAEMLGVQRPTSTHAVREFERAGLLEHGDGKSRYLIGAALRRHLANVTSWFGRALLFTCPTHTSDIVAPTVR